MDAFSTNASLVRSQTATIYRNIYPHNNDPEEASTYNESIPCNNISIECCSIKYCNYSVKQQISHFINGYNLFA